MTGPASTDRPVEGSAVLSDDGVYRYHLTRPLSGDGPPVTFGMLNPSTADATVNDQTIGKCIGFAERRHASGIAVVNAFAYRATEPTDMWRAAEQGADIVGPENDVWLRIAASESRACGGIFIVAWGVNVRHREARGRTAKVLTLLRREAPVYSLAVTKDGIPAHPLMLTYALTPTPYEGRGL